jgi:hypothetical protein
MSRKCRNGSMKPLTVTSAAPARLMYAPGFTLIRPSESSEIAMTTRTM